MTTDQTTERRAPGAVRQWRGVIEEYRDLLDLLMAAKNPESGAAFTYAEVRDQVATMILAGHETTAVLLFWAARQLIGTGLCCFGCEPAWASCSGGVTGY